MKDTLSTMERPEAIPIAIVVELAKLAHFIGMEAHRRLGEQDCQLVIRMEMEPFSSYINAEWGGLPAQVNCTLLVPRPENGGAYVPLGTSQTRMYVGDNGVRCRFFARPTVEGAAEEIIVQVAKSLVDDALKKAQQQNYLTNVQ